MEHTISNFFFKPGSYFLLKWHLQSLLVHYSWQLQFKNVTTNLAFLWDENICPRLKNSGNILYILSLTNLGNQAKIQKNRLSQSEKVSFFPHLCASLYNSCIEDKWKNGFYTKFHLSGYCLMCQVFEDIWTFFSSVVLCEL